MPTSPAPESFSAYDLVRLALQSLQRLAVGQDLDPDNANLGFTLLNGMIDTWQMNPLLRNVVTRSVYPVVANYHTYSIGVGGDFDQQRPVEIVNVGLITNPNAATPYERLLGRPLTLQHWQAIPMKTQAGTWPDRTYFDAGSALGLASLSVYPVPTSADASLAIYWPTLFDRFEERTTVYVFRPGVKTALWMNLAIELAPFFGADPARDFRIRAAVAKDYLQTEGGKPPELELPISLVGGEGRFNIYTG